MLSGDQLIEKGLITEEELTALVVSSVNSHSITHLCLRKALLELSVLQSARLAEGGAGANLFGQCLKKMGRLMDPLLSCTILHFKSESKGFFFGYGPQFPNY